MIVVLNNSIFDPVLDQIKQTIADDLDDSAVSIRAINDIVYELFNCCVDRVNIVDVDPEYQGLYQPFYEALNALLLQQNIPLISVANILVDGPGCWTVLLIMVNARGIKYEL